MTNTNIKLCRYPYPYQAALTLCSDLDRCSFADYRLLHQFLNTGRATSLGDGLGLEIGDSFWFYSAGSPTDDAFTYFEGLTTQPSSHAPFIRSGIQAGFIDCLHSYGHFSQHGGFRRKMAEEVVQEMHKQHLKISVWINHGEVHNFQNLGGLGFGDLPKQRQASQETTPSEEYHCDLLAGLGIRYAWMGALTPFVGQERSLSLAEKLRESLRDGGWRHALRLSLRQLRTPAALPWSYANSLMRRVQLRDHVTHLLEFQRFLPQLAWGQDFADDLKNALSPQNLDQLERNRGVMIAYVHLGKRRQGELFSNLTLKRLQDVAQRYHQGKIWIATTARLLRYLENRAGLRYQVQNLPDRILVHLEGVADRISTKLRPIEELSVLSGISFCTHSQLPIYLHSQNQEPLLLKDLGLDAKGRRCVGLPWQPLVIDDWEGL